MTRSNGTQKPGVLRSLPPRWLTRTEAEALIDQSSDRVRIFPAGMIETTEGSRITSLSISIVRSETMHAVGFDPASEGWVEIDSWGSDEYTETEANEAVDEFAKEAYGDDEGSFSTFDFDVE